VTTENSLKCIRGPELFLFTAILIDLVVKLKIHYFSNLILIVKYHCNRKISVAVNRKSSGTSGITKG
jgi:hypothetical protein